jgi:hypothetical protein
VTVPPFPPPFSLCPRNPRVHQHQKRASTISRFFPLYHLVLTSQRVKAHIDATRPPGQPVQIRVIVFIVRARDYACTVQAVKSLVKHTAYPFRATTAWKDATESEPSHVDYRGVDGEEGVLTLHGFLSRHLTLGLAINAAYRLHGSIGLLVCLLDHIAVVDLSVHKDWSTEGGDRLKDGRLVAR